MGRGDQIKKKLLILGFVLAPFVGDALAAKIEVKAIKSASMGKEIPALVVTPETYSKTSEHYPVVYLLHGKGAAYNHWLSAVPLAELSDKYNLIIVCPDGGKDSWYVDAPDDPTIRYGTYIASEVPQFIDENYRTIPSPKGRAICGASMGGHGAMLIALLHRDFFGAAGSTSGVLDLRLYAKNPSIGTSIAQRIGTIEEHPERWESFSAISHLADLKNGELMIMIDCGLQDPFLVSNQNFHEALLKANIEHTYIEQPGRHGWPYWKSSIPNQILFFHNFFEKQQLSTTASDLGK